ncbi:MAG TPA: hypothetical protein VMJ13_02415, partial [Candidatus Acidoferrum sp.]|nr:hypothetical protein [Candidatus Acidoferrum sp.]
MPAEREGEANVWNWRHSNPVHGRFLHRDLQRPVQRGKILDMAVELAKGVTLELPGENENF